MGGDQKWVNYLTTQSCSPLKGRSGGLIMVINLAKLETPTATCPFKLRVQITSILPYSISELTLERRAASRFPFTRSLNKVKQPIVVKIWCLVSHYCWNFLIFFHLKTSVRNNKCNWNYVFLTKYEFARNFWSVQCIMAQQSL